MGTIALGNAISHHEADDEELKGGFTIGGGKRHACKMKLIRHS